MNDSSTILLVEDEETDVMLMKMAFQEAGLNHVQVASDGREALRYLRGEGQYSNRELNPLPALVLLDLRLPHVPGLEVLREIRTSPRLRRMVVIVLTSSTLDRDIERAYELGVNSYLAKPCSPKDRREMIQLLRDYWLGKNLAARPEKS